MVRLLYLEPEGWRAEALERAFLQVSGQAVRVAASSSLGRFALDLQTAYDAVVLPPLIQPSKEQQGATKLDQLLPWYLAREKPKCGLWRFRGVQNVESETLHLGKQIDIRFLDYPEEESGYLAWAKDFVQSHRIPYLSPGRPASWWTSRPWLIVSGEETARASFAIKETDIESDLANFFALKAFQLQKSLGSECWLSWEFMTENRALTVQPARDGHTLVFRNEPACGTVSEESWSVLRELGLVESDA